MGCISAPWSPAAKDGVVLQAPEGWACSLCNWGKSNLNHHSCFPKKYKGRARSPHIAQSQSINQLKMIPSRWACLGMQHRTCWGWQLSAASGALQVGCMVREQQVNRHPSFHLPAILGQRRTKTVYPHLHGHR